MLYDICELCMCCHFKCELTESWLSCVFFVKNCKLICLTNQDDDEGGYNTSDEEFERQLEEAAILKEAEKAEAAAAPNRKRTKRGRGQGHRKKKTKTTSKFPNDPDAEGYEVGSGRVFCPKGGIFRLR